MEPILQYFQWGPDSMPRYLGFFTLLFGILTFLFVEGHAQKSKDALDLEKMQLEQSIAGLRSENQALDLEVASLSSEVENQKISSVTYTTDGWKKSKSYPDGDIYEQTLKLKFTNKHLSEKFWINANSKSVWAISFSIEPKKMPVNNVYVNSIYDEGVNNGIAGGPSYAETDSRQKIYSVRLLSRSTDDPQITMGLK